MQALPRLKSLFSWLPWMGLIALMGPALHAGNRAVGGDGPHMLGISMRLGWLLRSGRVLEALDGWLTLVAPHPPGSYLPPAILYAILGPVQRVDLLVGLLWLSMLWVGMVRTARHLMPGMPDRGLLAMAIGLAATPLVWQQIDNYGVDLASASMCMLALSWLVASDGLRDRRASIRAGALIGAGFWFKYTLPIFLYLPCLLVTVQALYGLARRRPGAATPIVNGLLLTAATLAVAGPLAVVSGQNILNYVFHSATPEASEIVGNLGSSFGPGVSVWDQKFFYVAVLRDLWGWPGVGLLGAGIALALALPGQRWRTIVVLSAAVGAFPILTDLDIKADRYLTPGLAPLLCVALPALARHWSGAVLSVAVLAAPVLFLWRDYSGWTHGLPLSEVTAFSAVDAADRWAPPGRDFDHLASVQLSTWGAWPKVEEPFRPFTSDVRDWDIESVLLSMAERHEQREGRVGLCLTEQHGTPGFGIFLMKAEQLGLHWDLVTVMVLRGQQSDGTPRTFQFIGPFKDGDDGDDETYPFDTLFVSYQRGASTPQRSYLNSLETSDAAVFDLPGGLEGQVVRVTIPEAP